MAITQRTAPTGIDTLISRHQNHLFNKVAISGFTNSTDWDSYDRAYGNPHENGMIPEQFTGDKEYSEVLFDDTNLITSFYWLGDRQTFLDNGFIESDVSLIVQAKIGNIYTDQSQRFDETLRQLFIWNSQQFVAYDSFVLDSVDMGVQNVYREFIKREINLTDMSEFHVFRLNYKVTYTPECCANC